MIKGFNVRLLLTVLLLTVYPVEAQQSAKLPRIGFVTAGSASTIAARIEALRQGLRDLGYIEDKNIIIEWRCGGESGSPSGARDGISPPQGGRASICGSSS